MHGCNMSVCLPIRRESARLVSRKDMAIGLAITLAIVGCLDKLPRQLSADVFDSQLGRFCDVGYFINGHPADGLNAMESKVSSYFSLKRYISTGWSWSLVPTRYVLTPFFGYRC